MPPQISSSPQRSDVADEGEGNFFTKKVGPLPMWAIIGAGIVVLYVLYTKFFSKTTSSSTPAVSTSPSTATTTGTPYDNFSGALSQIAANQQQIQSLLGTSASSTQNNTPAAAATTVVSTTNPSQTAPTATPISGVMPIFTPLPGAPPAPKFNFPIGSDYILPPSPVITPQMTAAWDGIRGSKTDPLGSWPGPRPNDIGWIPATPTTPVK
jgi:hypothetical protein